MKSVEAFETLPGEAWHPESLQATITELLYLFTGRGLLFLTITTLLMTLLLSADVPAALLFPWSLSLLALLGLRWRDYSAFRAARRRGESLEGERGRFWYRRFRDKALLTALLLGLAFPLFLPYLSESYLRYILLFFIIGTSAGSVSALFPHARLVTAYLILVNAPLFVHLLLMKEPYTTVAAMVQILFVIILLMIAQTSRLLMVRAWEQQKDLYAKERELDALFSQTPIPIFYFDTSMRVRKYNQAFRDFFRLPENFSMEGYDLRQLKHTPAVRVMERVLETRQPEEYDGQYLSTFRPDEFWILARVVPLFNEANELIGGIVSFQDKTLERQSIETLERLAAQDPLTDLGNRRRFYHTLRVLGGTPP
jgi:PAS domain-containing protein